MTDTTPEPGVSENAADSAEAVPFSVGTALREARMQQGLSIEEVSGRIKFAPRQVEALEADDFAHVPENAFLRGFVRSYARLLQLDPQPLLDALPHEPESSVQPQPRKVSMDAPYPGVYAERKSNIMWLGGALAVALVLGLFVLLFGEKRKEHAPTVQSAKVELPAAVPVSAVPDSEPAVQAPAAEAMKTITAPVPQTRPVAPAPQTRPVVPAPQTKPVAPAPVETQQVVKEKPKAVQPGQASIRMVFEADSWTEILDKDGQVLMGQLNHAGDERYVSGNPPFTVNIGYASGVKLYYKGQLVDLASHARAEVAHLILE